MKLGTPGDWGLRLLSLILAIVIYHALKPETVVSGNKHDRPISQHQ